MSSATGMTGGVNATCPEPRAAVVKHGVSSKWLVRALGCRRCARAQSWLALHSVHAVAPLGSGLLVGSPLCGVRVNQTDTQGYPRGTPLLARSRRRAAMSNTMIPDDVDKTTLVLATVGLVIASMLLTCLVQYLVCGPRARVTNSVRAGPIEPLLLNAQHAEDVSTSRSTAALAAATPAMDLVMPVRPAWGNLVLCVFFASILLGSIGFFCWVLVTYVAEIWKSGFVAALLIGGLAVGLRYVAVWIFRNIIVRRFCTTMQLSRENKESTPVLEWFKVWLPKYMKGRRLQFNNVAPLFRKKDGTTFFTMFQDTRRSDQFALSLWAMQGSHRFVFHAADGSSSLVTMVYYTKGEMKKTGWNNELVAQEYIDLYIFDPLHTRRATRGAVRTCQGAQPSAPPRHPSNTSVSGSGPHSAAHRAACQPIESQLCVMQQRPLLLLHQSRRLSSHRAALSHAAATCNSTVTHRPRGINPVRHMIEMLERAQEAYGQKEEGVLRFQRWNSWKEMWESRGADEPITTNFSSLVFYEQRVRASPRTGGWLMIEVSCEQRVYLLMTIGRGG